MIRVTANGGSVSAAFDRVDRDLQGFSPRRMRAAYATALTRTAVDVRTELRRELTVALDRPTPYTLDSLFVRPATADRLEAQAWFKDERAASRGGTPAAWYLLPNVEGGPRGDKGLERRLHALGYLPAGWRAVPGNAVPLDAHGNMPRGLLKQIVTQLQQAKATGVVTHQAMRRAGGRFFAVPPGAKGLPPGVYQREYYGTGLLPMLVFVRTALYDKRYGFRQVAERTAEQRFPAQLDRAIEEQRANLTRARATS